MDKLTSKILLTQINIIQQQLQALQSVILHVQAEPVASVIESKTAEHSLNQEIDKELGVLFESIAQNVEVPSE